MPVEKSGSTGRPGLTWPSDPTLSDWLSHIQLGERQEPQPSLLCTSEATTQLHLPLKVAKEHGTRRAIAPSGSSRCHLHCPNYKDSLKRGPQRTQVSFMQSVSLTPLFSVFLSFSLFLKRLEDLGNTPPSHIPLFKPLVSGQKNGQMRHAVGKQVNTKWFPLW